MRPDALTAYLHGQIPLTAAMGIAASACDGHTLSLAAPLAPNRNHTDTAFGGSISTLGIVAGWALLHAALVDHGVSAKLLIQHSATDYLRPADGDLTATAGFPDAQALPAFLKALAERRRARVELEARVCSGGGVVAVHHGSYVAILY
jgi:thioesterase domain-containing protein